MGVPYLEGVPAVDVLRGDRVESTHHVAACACDDTGRIILQRGSIDVPVFLRSSAKPFIGAAIVRSGAAEAFELDRREIAVICGSHTGEAGHLAAVTSILDKIGATADDLQCGVQGGSQLHNNCSGKHAGILALAKFRGAPFAGYLTADHPAQREILAFCERTFNDRFGPGRLAVDGCGIPVFATPLATAALAFARFATLSGFEDGDRRALAVVREAMVVHPWFVAGTGRLDTDLMEAAGGSVVAKGGAEGVHASAVIDEGIGLVLKVIDGARRAVSPAAIELLFQLEALEGIPEAALSPHVHPPVRNVAGRIVGEITARPGF